MPRRSSVLLLVTIAPALLGAAVFANTLANALVYDDPLAIEMSRLPLGELAMRRYGLTYMTIKLDHALWGSWPPGYHLTNVLLHAACAALAALCTLSLGGRPAAALLCGLLFAVHPVHTEAVASVENRKEMLAMLFAAVSVILYRSTRRPRWCYAGALACLALAMHAKEVAAVGLVAMLPLAGLLPGPEAADPAQRRRRALKRTLPLLVLGVLATGWYGGRVWRAFTSAEIARNTGSTFKTYGEVLATSAASIPDVGRLLVYPARLSADYPPPVRRRLTDRRSTAGLLLLAGFVAAAAVAARAAPLVAFGLAWTLITYLPVANVVPLTSYFLAERYLYVPSFGLCLAGAVALDGLYARSAARPMRALAAVLALALVLGGAARSSLRNRDWRDAVSLWTSALRAVPQGSSRIHAELGLALLEAGRGPEAIPHLQHAVEIGPVEADFHNNLGLALEQAERPVDAVAHYERALAMEPGNPLFRYNLGRALVRVGRADRGLAHLRIVAQEEAWTNAPPWVGAALAARGTSPAELCATLRDWLAARGAAAPTSPPAPPAR